MVDEEINILCENEKQANRAATRVMGITFIILTIIFILNLGGIFSIKVTIMTTVYLASGVLLLLPMFLIYVMRLENHYIKYINVISSCMFVMLLCITLT